MIVQNSNVLQLDISNFQSDLSHVRKASVIIPAHIINKIYQQASQIQKSTISPYGLQKGNIPLGYVEANFKHNIIEHIKRFLLNYIVISFLYKELREKKIVMAGEPRLNQIYLEPYKDAEFHFEFTPIPELDLTDWTYLSFKAPKRKNYKDLDKQATVFIKEELEKRKEYEKTIQKIEIGDWICFDIFIIDTQKNNIFDSVKENLWLKIGDDESGIPFQEIFLGKKIGDILYSNKNCLQEYFNNENDIKYMFAIEINNIIPNHFLSIDYLKDHFLLKSNKNVHQKLIEVFSFRNDLSLRRSIIEDFFDLFLVKFKFEIPSSAILRQQQFVLDALQTNPDYPVYKMQKGFDEKVSQLAEKQVKEMILIDCLSYYENIIIDNKDVQNYLNLSNRPRTKEFIYFQHQIIKANEQEYPIATESLKQSSLREKTLNYAIAKLTN